MCLMPENELPVILPPRRSHTFVKPEPSDGEPLTLGESLRFWVVVWVCSLLGGLTWGALIGYLRGAM